MICHTQFRKYANERLDWLFSYADWLTEGDTLASVQSEAEGINIDAAIEGDGVRLWLSGGDAGKTYAANMQITTAQGRVRNECIHARIKVGQKPPVEVNLILDGTWILDGKQTLQEPPFDFNLTLNGIWVLNGKQTLSGIFTR